MSRRPEQQGEAIARQAVAAQIAELVAEHYGARATVSRYETNTGLQQVRVQFSDEIAYHLTITRARK